MSEKFHACSVLEASYRDEYDMSGSCRDATLKADTEYTELNNIFKMT